MNANCNRSPRPGISLVELLVVVAIIGTLAALLLPAVQKMRGAASRIRCANNLKQIGLALHQHHDVHGRFPNNQRAAWTVQILPWLEQDTLFREYDSTRSPFDPPNASFGERQLAVYTCHSDSSAEQSFGWHVTNYPHSTELLGLRLLDVRDGTAYTGLALEMQRQDLGLAWHLGPAHPIITAKCHGGAFHVLFADGHTRLVPATISSDILKAIRTPAGAEILTDDSF